MFPLCLNELQTSTGHYNSRIPAQLRSAGTRAIFHYISSGWRAPSGGLPSHSCPPLLSHRESFHRIQGFTDWESQGCFYSGGVRKVAPLFQVFYKHSSRGSSLPWRVSAFGKTRLIGRLSKQGRGDVWEWGQASHPTQVPYSKWHDKYKEQSGHPHSPFLPSRKEKTKKPSP